MYLRKCSQLLFKWLVFLSFSLLSCQQSNSEKFEFPSVEFAVDSLLIGQSISFNEDFILSIPAGWNPLNDSLNCLAENALENDSAGIKLNFIAGFISENGSVCSISKIIDKDGDMFSMDITNNLKVQFNTEAVVRGLFSINGIPVTQYRIVTPVMTVFKLYFKPTDVFYQIDFFLSAQSYHNEIRSIESSLGTLNRYK